MSFFEEQADAPGAPVTDETVRAAEVSLGVRLPAAYVALLRQQNGGVPERRCFPMTRRTSWASDHIAVATLLGLGTVDGIDGELGSEYMIQEWGYPGVGIVIFSTPSGGHDTVMLDYTQCGSQGEPRVVYVDEDRIPVPVASSFKEFIDALVDGDRFQAQ